MKKIITKSVIFSIIIESLSKRINHSDEKEFESWIAGEAARAGVGYHTVEYFGCTDLPTDVGFTATAMIDGRIVKE